MNKIDTAGHLVQWAIELGQFNTEYRPRVAVKAQVLADFIVEFTCPHKEEKLQLYLAVSNTAVSLTLIREKEDM